MKHFIRVAVPNIVFLAFFNTISFYIFNLLVMKKIAFQHQLGLGVSIALLIGILYTYVVIKKYNEVSTYVEFRKIKKKLTRTIVKEEHSKEEAYNLCQYNLSKMKNCEIIYSDHEIGKIVAKTNCGLCTCGEKIAILIHEIDEKIVIKIISYSIFNQSLRKNKQNLRWIYNQIS
ncbi:hypothetical protein [Vallitalea okinawensis]|uniref:hypothetical protein n=1 Tax=Vallitalea okinawensis TaxID=2078660 RepID=UPI000CFD6EF8|nr:hypothetical protein [Vallitalea okinawensis]